jgi:hypothetical protein
MRRSTRKRKQRFPSGALLGQDTIRVDLSGNIASLRLTLYQNCSQGNAYELHHRLSLCVHNHHRQPQDESTQTLVSSSTNGVPLKCAEEYIIFDLDLEQNENSLRSILEPMLDDLDAINVADTVCFIRSTADLRGLFDFSSDELMQTCISQANMSESNEPESDHGSSKRAKKMEKGFRGTLLTSGPPVASNTVTGSISDPSQETISDVIATDGILPQKVTPNAVTNCVPPQESIPDETDNSMLSQEATEIFV